MDIDEQLQKGIQAAKTGELQKASGILANVVKDVPNSEEAWLWLGKSRTIRQEREYCFKRVLQINPQNIEAKMLLGESDQVASKSAQPLPDVSLKTEVKKPDPSNRRKILAFASGFILALLFCGFPFIYLVSTGRLRQMTNPFAYAAQTAAVMPVSSVTPSPVATETPTPDISSLSFSQRYEIANPYISEALEYSLQGLHTEAILGWDKALEIIPEWAEGYYNRGNEYLDLLQNQRSQEEFLLYLTRAGEDFDKAIELKPYSKGDYYLGRYKYFDHLSAVQTYRVERIQLQQIALDNLLMANRLGNYDPLADRYVIFSNITVGNCDEGIEQANQLIATTVEPAAAFPTGLALGYMCKNDAEQALQYINEAITISDNCTRRFERARILYALGRIDDAIADLDYTISKDPYYCGDRYYLRGLLHVEKGDLTEAEEDLFFGMGQTWGRGGFLPYAQGKIALAQGDKESAVQYFQYAESTYYFVDPILLKIRDDLAALEADPIEVTSSFLPATVIPLPTPLLTPRPTSSPDPSLPTPVFTLDPYLQSAEVVDIEKPIEQLFLGWGFQGLWLFQPAQPLDHHEVQSLSVWLISSDTSQRLPRQLSLWNFRSNMWGGNNELHWGENRINFPNEYVSPDGDVYIRLDNQDDTLETLIDTFGVTLVLQRTDGSIEVHGIVP